MEEVIVDDGYGGPPKELICPITQEIMVEPVIAADGYTYERQAIERWLSGASHQRSPTTNAAMFSRQLTPNRLLGSMIASYTGRLGAKLVEACKVPRDGKAVEKRVRALVEAGADVNTRDDAGKTCLVLACARGRCTTANALLDAGARAHIDAVMTLVAVVEAARAAMVARGEDTRRAQVEELLSPPEPPEDPKAPIVARRKPDDDRASTRAPLLIILLFEEEEADEEDAGEPPPYVKGGDDILSREELEALEAVVGRIRERIEETRQDEARRAAAARDEQETQAAQESVARNGQNLVAAMGAADGARDAEAGGVGVFGAARLRQRGYFPSLFALQFSIQRSGTSREPRCTFFAFLDDAALVTPAATHDERASARRLRAAILILSITALFYLSFS